MTSVSNASQIHIGVNAHLTLMTQIIPHDSAKAHIAKAKLGGYTRAALGISPPLYDSMTLEVVLDKTPLPWDANQV